MEYQVPQFIEVEDKIFGPFTLKQFIYVAGGIGLCAMLVLYLPLLVGIALALPVGAFTAALAFYKINNRSFVEVLESGFKYYLGNNLYLWRKETPQAKVGAMGPKAATAEPVRAKLGLSRGKLQDLAWSLDIKDRNAPEEL